MTVKVSALSALNATLATYTYGITNASTDGKVPVHASDGLVAYTGSDFLPYLDQGTALGTGSKRFLSLYGNLAFSVNFSSGVAASTFKWTDGTGPAFKDRVTAKTLTFNVQSLTGDRAVTWPDAPGTVTLLGNASTGGGAVVLAAAPTMTNPVVGTQTAGDNSTKAASTAYADRRDTVTALTISSGVVNIDCSMGDFFTLELSANVTSFTFSNLPASGMATTKMIRITQNASAAKTVTLSGFKWPGGTAGVVSTALSAVDDMAITTFDQGATWDANLANAYA